MTVYIVDNNINSSNNSDNNNDNKIDKLLITSVVAAVIDIKLKKTNIISCESFRPSSAHRIVFPFSHNSGHDS